MTDNRIIEHVQLNELKWDEENPNAMSKAQLEALKQSIGAYGNLQPIVVDQDNNIVDGAHRALAYQQLGMATVPAIRITLTNEEDKRIIRQTMNKLRGTHDPEKDAKEFVAILKANRESDLFKVSAIRETDFYKTIGKQPAKVDEDDAPPLPDKAITQTGDIWQMGEHRLMCGDSTSEADANKLMDGVKCAICVTDPPYGVDYVQGTDARDGGKKWRNIANDELKGKALQEFCQKFLKNISIHSTDDAAYYIFFGMKTLHHLLQAMDAEQVYYALPLLWLKGRATISWAKYHPDYEVAAYGGPGAKRPPKKAATEYKEAALPIAFSGQGAKPHQERWYAKYDQATTWQCRPDFNAHYLHPTQKPVELADKALLNSSKEGEVCLDLFAGSGFSLISCHKLKRIWRGMEMDPLYCDVIVQRWEAYTGLKAERITTKEK